MMMMMLRYTHRTTRCSCTCSCFYVVSQQPFIVAVLLCFILLNSFHITTTTAAAADLSSSNKYDDDNHIASSQTNNYAVIVSASRYWFNYRHNSNALSIYQFLKQNGYDDENIILMLSDDYITNPRNPAKNAIYNTPNVIFSTTVATKQKQKQLYQKQLQSWKHSVYDPYTTKIDYRGDDVTVENFIKVLVGHGDTEGQQLGLPPVLKSNSNSNVLIYMTGHGGDSFFKFNDIEEVLAEQIGTALEQMNERGMYRSVLLIADTCQAFTLSNFITSPNVIMIGSSMKGQSSYAHHSDPYLGLSIIEKYTYHLLQHIQRHDPTLQNTIYKDMIEPYPFHQQRANIGYTNHSTTSKTDPCSATRHNSVNCINCTGNECRSVHNIVMNEFFTSRDRPTTKSKQGTKRVHVVGNMYDIFYISHHDKIEDPVQRIELHGHPHQPHRDQQHSKNRATGTGTVVSNKYKVEPSDTMFLLLVACLVGTTFVFKITLLR